MAARTVTITLGEFSFVAHKFNLGETEEIADLQDAMRIAGSLRERLVVMREMVLLAARRDNPDLADDDLKSIEATPAELSEAVMAINRLNGYTKVAAAGEAQAEDPAA